VQLIENTPADLQLVLNTAVLMSLLNSSAYLAVKSGVFSDLNSKLAAINKTQFAKIICKKIICNYLPISNYKISLYLFLHHGIE
jgi:hypothetical protein